MTADATVNKDLFWTHYFITIEAFIEREDGTMETVAKEVISFEDIAKNRGEAFDEYAKLVEFIGEPPHHWSKELWKDIIHDMVICEKGQWLKEIIEEEERRCKEWKK